MQWTHPHLGELTTEFSDRVPKDREKNIAYRINLLQKAEKDVGLQRALKQMCKLDILFTFNVFNFLYEPRTSSAIPWITWDYQDETVMNLVDSLGQYDVLIEKSRDMGATWMAVGVSEWGWHFHPNFTFLYGSRKQEEVDKSRDYSALMPKIDWLHKHQPPWLVPFTHRKELHCFNAELGGAIDGESTNAGFGISGRYFGIFLDEAALMECAPEIIAGTADVSRSRWIVSTHYGTHTEFYRLTHPDGAPDGNQTHPDGRWLTRHLKLLWTKHPEKKIGMYEYEEGGVRKVSSPWRDAECSRPGRTRAWIAQHIDMNPQGSRSQFFLQEHIDLVRSRDARPPFLRGHLRFDSETGEPERFDVDEKGPLQLWLNLQPNGRPPEAKYVCGSDISAGMGSSNSSASFANVTTGEKIAELTTPNLREIDFANYVVALCRWFRSMDGTGAKLAWEMNGSLGLSFGKRVFEDLQYTNIYWRHDETNATKKLTHKPGWFASPTAKKRLLDEYSEALGNRFINRSLEAINECSEYIYTPDGTDIVHSRSLNKTDPAGAKRNHGDRTIADALAWRLLKEAKPTKAAVTGPLDVAGEAPVGSLGWRLKMDEEAQIEKNELPWL